MLSASEKKPYSRHSAKADEQGHRQRWTVKRKYCMQLKVVLLSSSEKCGLHSALARVVASGVEHSAAGPLNVWVVCVRQNSVDATVAAHAILPSYI